MSGWHLRVRVLVLHYSLAPDDGKPRFLCWRLSGREKEEENHHGPASGSTRAEAVSGGQ